jgi:chromosome segregation ATPase
MQVMKKNSKEKIKRNTEEKAYSKKEMEHYLGALNKIHGETLKGINENFVIVNLKIDRINDTLDEHTRILDEHSKMLGTHTNMIASLAKDVTEIKGELKKKVNYDEFNRRVGRLEAKVL